MGKCLASLSYTMKADIYVPSISQDATGAVVKTWTLDETVDCVVRGILRKGVGDNSVSTSLEEYINAFTSTLKMRSQSVIPTDHRVVNIRNNDVTIFVEDQDPSSEGGINNATIFEPRGSTPLIGYDGRVIEYETVLMRQQIQRLTI